MLKDKNAARKGMNGLCEDVGKICIFAAFVYSVFVLAASLRGKSKDEDYQERLRKAYSGLSPEDY